MTATYDPQPVLDLLRPFGLRWNQSTGRGTARCPGHDDRQASLTVKLADRIEGGGLLLNCHRENGCGKLDICAGLGITIYDLLPPRSNSFVSASTKAPWMTCMIRDGQPVDGHAVKAEYHYTDEHGTVIRGVSRCVQKCFRQWRPDPSRRSGRTWRTTLDDGTEVGADLIYRLPQVLAALRKPGFTPNIWLPEGEKDCNRLWSLGYPATTNPQGAGKWTAAHAAWLHGADVIVVADRDEAGERHARAVVGTLIPIARSIEVRQAAEGKDVSDHLDAGLTLQQLVTVWTPLPEPDAGATVAEYEAASVG